MAKRRTHVVPALSVVAAGLALLVAFPTALRPPPDEATTSAEFSPDAPPEDQPEAIIQSLQQAGSRTAGASGRAIAEALRAEQSSAPPRSTTTTTTAPPRTAAVRNRCYGDPPRQIESVYSPECTPAFVGDNGGETARGVTATEIRIAFAPDLSGAMGGSDCGEIAEARPGESDARRTYRVLRDWFNQNLELYGRKLRFYYACAADGTSGEEAARSRVVKMRQEYDVFGGIGEFNATIAKEAARNELVYMANIVVSGDTFYRNLQPWVWGSRAHSTRAVDMSAEYLCRRLHGNLPFPTGDARIDYGSPRTYGILALEDANTAESVAGMEQKMKARCGAEPKVIARYNLDDNVQGLSTAMTQLSAARVSTIIFMGEILTLPTQAQIADQQNYFPEWYVMGAGGFETSISLARSVSPRQWKNAFGFSFEEIPRRPRSTPCYRAYRSLDPERNPNNSVCEILFHSMLFMFGAMQDAGPQLTPARWASSLERAFTRPATPEWSMSGGFSKTDYTYGDFAVELYWDPTAIHPDGNPGAYVYLNDGIRFLPDDIQTGQPPMFQGGITDGDNAGEDNNAFN
ncbi:MAG TPA: hypothetical protein VM143_09955 [Acidimicrobiales bacterium]|nr:hypothetical protein [Acidimicrobiales bacterium]